jgi:hypothetical protein
VSRLIRARAVPLGGAAGLLLALLALSQVQATHAACGVLWRQVVVSWDNPSTQFLEETASQSVPHTDPVGDARAGVAPDPAPRRVLLPAAPASARHLDAGARVTRAPPA